MPQLRAMAIKLGIGYHEFYSCHIPELWHLMQVKRQELKRKDAEMMNLAFLIRKATHLISHPVDKYGNAFDVFEFWPLPWDGQFKKDKDPGDEKWSDEKVASVLDKFQNQINAEFKGH